MIARLLPIQHTSFDLAGRRPGLVIIDEVKGFAAVGCGPLAPPVPDPRISRMIAETDRLARSFIAAGWPVLASLDSHHPDQPEPPYPPHCLEGSGHDRLVDELAWLESEPGATLIAKDCINLFVGAIKGDRNHFLDWIAAHRLDTLVTVGICTDICVMDFVLTLLSVRNHALAPGLEEIVVYEPACATYDLPAEVAASLGLPPTAAHPAETAHHAGLYFMASRGVVLADELTGGPFATA